MIFNEVTSGTSLHSLCTASGLGGTESTVIGASALVSESVSIDALGNASTRKSYLNRGAHAAASVTTTPDSTLPAYSISVCGLSLTNCTSAGIVSSREYDALGRQVAMSLSSHESPRSGVNVSGLRPSLITKHSLRSALGILLSPSPGEGCFQRSATGIAREKRLPFAEIRGKKTLEAPG
ncbi:MAG: hypothetical protein GX615_07415 [Lentisphaerae bacterium]|nr:hypothetical protein [Lentisphaerota bacterium]